jgi:hypothetical protein
MEDIFRLTINDESYSKSYLNLDNTLGFNPNVYKEVYCCIENFYFEVSGYTGNNFVEFHIDGILNSTENNASNDIINSDIMDFFVGSIVGSNMVFYSYHNMEKWYKFNPQYLHNMKVSFNYPANKTIQYQYTLKFKCIK